MEVNVPHSPLPAERHWHVPIIVSKIADDSVIELIVTRK